MRMKRSAILVGLSFAILAGGCAQPPTELADAAKARLDAVAAEAATYAPDAYEAAAESAAQLDAELEAQAGRFGPLRSYDRAEELVASVESAADRVSQAIVAGKERLQAEANGAIADGRRALEAARGVLGEEGMPAAQVSAWEAELAAAETALARAEELAGGEQQVEARREAQAALAAVTKVNSAVAVVQLEREEAREAAVARAARGDVSLPRRVLVGGTQLAAGSYSLRLAEEVPPAANGLGAGRWVEFVRNGSVAGRELAVAIPNEEIGTVAKSPGPRNEARVESLRESDYVRIWLNRSGVNYLLHLPVPQG